MHTLLVWHLNFNDKALTVVVNTGLMNKSDGLVSSCVGLHSIYPPHLPFLHKNDQYTGEDTQRRVPKTSYDD